MVKNSYGTIHSDGDTGISDSSVDNFNSSLTDDSFADSFRSIDIQQPSEEKSSATKKKKSMNSKQVKIKLLSITTHPSDEDAGLCKLMVIDDPQDQVRKPTPLKRRAINDNEPNNSKKSTSLNNMKARLIGVLEI
ncbi:hypothetical protein BCR42DRAFT_443160 [Absidia repens]|uniref:Uncharacterized protein n=1 Tax=Absidia repens TaxID=90262 RepID=A0A1X2HZW1_9FUNG|nr:hypothetical protein BCR42DRAFT_443160 [Absidia repens]